MAKGGLIRGLTGLFSGFMAYRGSPVRFSVKTGSKRSKHGLLRGIFGVSLIVGVVFGGSVAGASGNCSYYCRTNNHHIGLCDYRNGGGHYHQCRSNNMTVKYGELPPLCHGKRDPCGWSWVYSVVCHITPRDSTGDTVYYVEAEWMYSGCNHCTVCGHYDEPSINDTNARHFFERVGTSSYSSIEAAQAAASGASGLRYKSFRHVDYGAVSYNCSVCGKYAAGYETWNEAHKDADGNVTELPVCDNDAYLACGESSRFYYHDWVCQAYTSGSVLYLPKLILNRTPDSYGKVWHKHLALCTGNMYVIRGRDDDDNSVLSTVEDVPGAYGYKRVFIQLKCWNCGLEYRYKEKIFSDSISINAYRDELNAISEDECSAAHPTEPVEVNCPRYERYNEMHGYDLKCSGCGHKCNGESGSGINMDDHDCSDYEPVVVTPATCHQKGFSYCPICGSYNNSTGEHKWRTYYETSNGISKGYSYEKCDYINDCPDEDKAHCKKGEGKYRWILTLKVENADGSFSTYTPIDEYIEIGSSKSFDFSTWSGVSDKAPYNLDNDVGKKSFTSSKSTGAKSETLTIKRKRIKITFDMDLGGKTPDIPVPPPIEVIYGSKYPDPPDPSKPNTPSNPYNPTNPGTLWGGESHYDVKIEHDNPDWYDPSEDITITATTKIKEWVRPDGTPIKKGDTVPTSDITLKAVWEDAKLDAELKKLGDKIFNLSYDGNGGTLTGGTSGDSGYKFLGWYNGDKKVSDGGEKISVDKNMTLKAKWEVLKHELPKAEKEGQEFMGWYTDKQYPNGDDNPPNTNASTKLVGSGGNKIGLTSNKNDNNIKITGGSGGTVTTPKNDGGGIKLTAWYKIKVAYDYDWDEKKRDNSSDCVSGFDTMHLAKYPNNNTLFLTPKYTKLVTPQAHYNLKLNGGIYGISYNIIKGTCPFEGWWLTSDYQEGTQVVTNDVVSTAKHHTLYNKWGTTYTDTNVPIPNRSFDIEFVPEGGNLSGSNHVTGGSKFLGWYEGNTLVTMGGEKIKLDKNTELTAHWEKINVEMPSIDKGSDRFLGWYTEPQYIGSDNHINNNDTAECVARDAGDIINVGEEDGYFYWENITTGISGKLPKPAYTADFKFYAWWNKAPVYADVYDGLFFEGQDVSYKDMLSLVAAFDYEDDYKDAVVSQIYVLPTIDETKIYLPIVGEDTTDWDEERGDIEIDGIKYVFNDSEWTKEQEGVFRNNATGRLYYTIEKKMQLEDKINASKLVVKIESIEYDVKNGVSGASDKHTVLTASNTDKWADDGFLTSHYLDTGTKRIDMSALDKSDASSYKNCYGDFKVRFVVTDNGFKVAGEQILDSPITMHYTRKCRIQYNNAPLLYLRNITWFEGTEPTADALQSIIDSQLVLDAEDCVNNPPWWYKTKEDADAAGVVPKGGYSFNNLQDSIKEKGVWNIILSGSLLAEHPDKDLQEKVDNLDITVSELVSWKNNEDKLWGIPKKDLYSAVTSFSVEFVAKDQFGKKSNGKVDTSGLKSGSIVDPLPDDVEGVFDQDKEQSSVTVYKVNKDSDSSMLSANTREQVRFINNKYLPTLGTSYWGSSGYGLDILKDVLARRENADMTVGKDYTGEYDNKRGDKVNIRVKDYSE